jgi:flagellar basal-body rod protein FlgB
MFDITSEMKINKLLEKALDVESLRRKVIANNVANVDVPHFKRSEVNFESELRRVIAESRDPDNKLPAKMTDQRHIPFYTPRDIDSVEPRVNLDYDTTQRNDGNNVDIEKEITDSAKNQLRYNAYITMMNNNFRNLKNAMRMVS